MGILDSVERGLERAVRGTFIHGSRSRVHPVEIASRIRREMDDKAITLSAGHTLSPNVMDVRLSESDFDRAKSWGSALAEELCDVVLKHARSQGYSLQGPVRVSFTQNLELKSGSFNVRSTTEKVGGSPRQQAYPQRPQQAPRRPTAEPASHRPAQRLQPVLDIDGQRYTLNAKSVVLGRSSNADILVDDTGVSRRHVEVASTNNGATAVDLGSTNGVFLNGRRISGSQALRDGDKLKIGRTEMTFHLVRPGNDAGRGGR